MMTVLANVRAYQLRLWYRAEWFTRPISSGQSVLLEGIGFDRHHVQHKHKTTQYTPTRIRNGKTLLRRDFLPEPTRVSAVF